MEDAESREAKFRYGVVFMLTLTLLVFVIVAPGEGLVARRGVRAAMARSADGRGHLSRAQPACANRWRFVLLALTSFQPL